MKLIYGLKPGHSGAFTNPGINAGVSEKVLFKRALAQKNKIEN